MYQQKSCFRIKHAFLQLLEEKEVDSIRIAELLLLADVSKTTFYTYYENMGQLVIDIINDLLTTLDRQIVRRKNRKIPLEEYEIIVEWVLGHKRSLQGLLLSKYQQKLWTALYQYFSELITYHQQILSGNLDYEGKQGQFLAYAFVGCLSDTLQKDKQEECLFQAAAVLAQIVSSTVADQRELIQCYPFRNPNIQCQF